MGKLTIDIGEGFAWARSVGLEMMWLVIPLSKIQGLVNVELIEVLEEENKPTTFA